MKKNAFYLACFLFFCITAAKTQTNFYAQAPYYDGSVSNLSAPNGSSGHAYMRAVMLVKPGELTGMPNNTITTFGFSILSGNASVPGAGNFTLYLQNTTDITYNKGTSFSGALPGMTLVYGSSMTIPVTSGSAIVTVSLSTPFIYNGGGIYVAYDWYQPGPNYSTQLALYQCNSTGLSVGGARNAGTSGPAADLLTTTAFRPAFLFGTVNTFTNELNVEGMTAPAQLPVTVPSHQVRALLKNSSVQTQTNVVVSLTAVGANPATLTQTVSSLASGATTVVVFPNYVPAVAGTSTLAVSVPSDENNLNNIVTFTQEVTCDKWTLSPPGTSYTANAIGFPSGNGGIMAVKYSNTSNTYLKGFKLGVSNNSSAVGVQVCGGLFDSFGSLLATTQTLNITATMLGSPVTFSFSTPQLLTTGTTPYYFGFIQVPGQTNAYPIGAATSSIILYNTSYFNIPISGGSPSGVNTQYGYIGIEAIMAPSATLHASPLTIACGLQSVLSATTTAPSYTWSSGPANANFSVNPLASTVYSLNTGSGSCIFSNTISVNVIPISVNAVAGTPSVCAGSSVSLSGSGATSYTWNVNPPIYSTSITTTPSVTTTYTVQGSQLNGCLNTATVKVTVATFTNLTLSATSFTVCKGDNFTVTASGANSYTWTSGTTTLNGASIVETPSVNVVYTLVATAGNGCRASEIIPVDVQLKPAVAVGAQVPLICLGQSNTLVATGAHTYTWSVNSQTDVAIVVTPAVSGTAIYTVTGTGQNGYCAASATVNFEVNSCANGLHDAKANEHINLYPNPSDGIVYLVFENSEPHEIVIMNMLGVEIEKQAVDSFETQVDLTQLPGGVYLCIVSENGKIVFNKKVIKQ